MCPSIKECMRPFAQALCVYPIGLIVIPDESVPQRGTRMRNPAQARNERSTGASHASPWQRGDPRGHTSIVCVVPQQFLIHGYLRLSHYLHWKKMRLTMAMEGGHAGRFQSLAKAQRPLRLCQELMIWVKYQLRFIAQRTLRLRQESLIWLKYQLRFVFIK